MNTNFKIEGTAYEIIARVLKLVHIKDNLYKDETGNTFVITKYGFKSSIKENTALLLNEVMKYNENLNNEIEKHKGTITILENRITLLEQGNKRLTKEREEHKIKSELHKKERDEEIRKEQSYFYQQELFRKENIELKKRVVTANNEKEVFKKSSELYKSERDDLKSKRKTVEVQNDISKEEVEQVKNKNEDYRYENNRLIKVNKILRKENKDLANKLFSIKNDGLKKKKNNAEFLKYMHKVSKQTAIEILEQIDITDKEKVEILYKYIGLNII